MILIADSGSTKTDWCVVDSKGMYKTLTTKGINPYYQSEAEIAQEVSTTVTPQLSDCEITEIYFYGAGCTVEKKEIVANSLAAHFPHSNKIEVHSDLLGAARAMCQHKKGIVAILGTGSNSALYDGTRIEQNISPLGYILGDEGSGAVLGKEFINLLLKNQLSQQLKDNFFQEFALTPSDIIENVYRRPFPNRFLAQFAPFIQQNIQNEIVFNMVEHSFNDFLNKNIIQYPQSDKLPIHFVGSIAFHFQDILKKSLLTNRLNVGNIEKTPMKRLISYHLNNY